MKAHHNTLWHIAAQLATTNGGERYVGTYIANIVATSAQFSSFAAGRALFFLNFCTAANLDNVKLKSIIDSWENSKTGTTRPESIENKKLCVSMHNRSYLKLVDLCCHDSHPTLRNAQSHLWNWCLPYRVNAGHKH